MASRTATRRAASQNGDRRRQIELETERDRTVRRIERLDVERASLEQRIRQVVDARNQMVGRLRLVQEQLGEEAPMTDIEVETSPEPEPAEGG